MVPTRDNREERWFLPETRDRVAKLKNLNPGKI